jgi:hypothetical protein
MRLQKYKKFRDTERENMFKKEGEKSKSGKHATGNRN